MSATAQARRLTVEVRADDPGALARVGNRPLPHFWPVLAAYFRDVLLPPQRRAEDAVILWAWHEPAEARAPSAAELAAVRKKLAGNQQLLAENLESVPRAGAAAGANVGHEGLGAAMQRMVAGLISLPDAELGRFVCRTESGVRVHSWGAAEPGVPCAAGQRTLDVSGCLQAGGRPVRGREIRLVNARGETQARVRTTRAGEFRFSSVAAGTYRVRATLGRVQREAPVVIEAESVAGLVLAFESAPQWRGRWLIVLAVAGLGVGALLSRRATPRADVESRSKPRADATTSARTKNADVSRPGSAQSKSGSRATTASSSSASLATAGSTRNEKPFASEEASAARKPIIDDRPRVAGGGLGAGATTGTPVAGAHPIRAAEGNAVSDAATTTSQGPADATALAASRSVTPTVPEGQKTAVRPDHVAAVLAPTDTAFGEPDKRAPEFLPPRASAATTATADPEKENAITVSAVSVTDAPTSSSTRVNADPVWATESRVRLSPWRLEFLGDAILPTQPTRVRDRDALAALRADFLATQRDALPRSLREGVIETGLRFRFPAGVALRWQLEREAVTRLEPSAAEIMLPAERENFRAVLHGDGQRVAELSYDADQHEWRVRATSGVEVTWFFDAPVASSDAARLVWRGASAKTLPPGVEVAPSAISTSRVIVRSLSARAACALAFFDPETGWARVGEIAETRASAAGFPR